MKNIKENYFVGTVIAEENSNTFKVKVIAPEKILFQEDIDYSSIETDTEIINTWENSFIHAGDIVYISTNHIDKVWVYLTYTFHIVDIVAVDDPHIEKIEKRYDKEK